MSRFATIIKHKNLTVEMPEIEAMTAGLSPEGQPGAVFIKDNMAFGSNRLFFNKEKTMAIVFDGELTGSKTLQEEFSHCSAASDAETVIHACEQWGIETALQRLDGAFAFTLYDISAETVYIARDRLGIKPLYYFRDQAGLYAASTLRMLTKTSFPKIISKEGLNLFFSLTCIPAPYTIYENILKLPAGHYLTIHNDDAVLQPYYRPEDHIHPSGLTFDRAKEQLKALLTDSVKTLLEDNDAAGAFLSGGLDSSVVVGIMSQHAQKPIPTFSIGFKEKEHDETDRAKLVSETFHTDHTIHYLDYTDVMDVLDEIIDYFDEPFGDSSAIPTYYVAKLASEKVKTVFTGDCADELFGGYNKYLSAHFTNIFLRIPKPFRYPVEKTIRLIPGKAERQPWIRKIKKIAANASRSNFEAYFHSLCIGYPDKERRQLLMPEFFADIRPVIEKAYNRYRGADSVNNAMFADILVSLEGEMFPKMERMCMMNSLISRSPFSGVETVNFALSSPAAYKVKGLKKKYIVREAFKDLLPEKIIKSRKHGFTAPVAHWLRKELKQDLLNLLDKKVLEKQGIFNADAVTCLVEEHLKGSFDHSPVLWNLLVFQKWYAKNLLK